MNEPENIVIRLKVALTYPDSSHILQPLLRDETSHHLLIIFWLYQPHLENTIFSTSITPNLQYQLGHISKFPAENKGTAIHIPELVFVSTLNNNLSVLSRYR